MEKHEVQHFEEKVVPVGEHVEYLDSSTASLEASTINEKALIRKT
jgi:exonuclease VII small subunit